MLRYRALPSLSMRMLLSSSPPALHYSPNPNPNPKLNPTYSISDSASNRRPILFSKLNPVRFFELDSHRGPQSMTLSKCLSGSTHPVPISSLPGSQSDSDSQILVVVSFYKFADFPDHARLRQPLKQLCEELVVIDVRNNYETRIGKFKGAVDPCTKAFRVEDQFQPSEYENGQLEAYLNSADGSDGNEQETSKPKTPPRVAMYCTGGIRCEKASSYLLSKGFEEVSHLEGGILKYLEEVPKKESLWEGECFV